MGNAESGASEELKHEASQICSVYEQAASPHNQVKHCFGI